MYDLISKDKVCDIVADAFDTPGLRTIEPPIDKNIINNIECAVADSIHEAVNAIDIGVLVEIIGRKLDEKYRSASRGRGTPVL